MNATLSHPALAPRVELAAHAGTLSRLDVSTRIGLDVDLVLGPIGGDADEADELARLYALVDMVDSGFITSAADLDLVAGLVDDMTDEDDARGYEDDEMFAGRWAA
jgi:hypothetical protein